MKAGTAGGFTTGGAVPVSNCYVERDADVELRERLARFEFCYVFAPRQTGKSSLRVRTIHMLREQGRAATHVDLLNLYRGDSVDRLWREIDKAVQAELERVKATVAPWEPAQMPWPDYLRDVVIPALPAGLILFVDETNVAASFRFDAGILFGALRTLHDQRSEHPDLSRFAVCFLGVARAGDLVADQDISPFAIAHPVTLRDFTREEAKLFEPLLSEHFGERAAAIVDEAHEATSGHPYMLQNVLAGVTTSRAARESDPEEIVKKSVEARFFERDDPILDVPRSRFGGDLTRTQIEALQQYRLVVAGKEVPVAQADGRKVQEELWLAGMVRLEEGPRGLVRSRNAIFARRYDHGWVSDLLDPLTYDALAGRWVESGSDPDFLLRGAALRAAEKWLVRQERNVRVQTAEYVKESTAASERAHAALRGSRFRTGMVITTVALLTTTIGVWLYRQATDQVERSIQAERQSLEAQIEALKAREESNQKLVAQYEAESKRLAEEREALGQRNREAQSKLQDLENESRKLNDQLRDAVAGSRDRARLARQLDDVNKQIAATAEERDRTARELAAAKQRESTLSGYVDSLQKKLSGLKSDLDAAGADLKRERQTSSGLSQQLEALNQQLGSMKKQVGELSSQLADVQGRYATCTTTLSATKADLDAARTRAAACEARPAPPPP